MQMETLRHGVLMTRNHDGVRKRRGRDLNPGLSVRMLPGGPEGEGSGLCHLSLLPPSDWLPAMWPHCSSPVLLSCW